ncbi:hypothetical protein [Bacillus sp. Marseille-P3661]|nr:hypothetical protein [Bacillus sp. Marseille-P3661]
MFNQKVLRLLLGSTILSTIFSLVMISMTAYHHFTIRQLIKEYNRE